MVNINLQLPQDFYKDEERDGYLVTGEMKKIWAVELDLLNKLLEVCNKYNLRVFADGGTLLGAVRHKGFIPWDDDIDVIMFRPDYEKLIKVAEKEFKDPYFFQCYWTEKKYHRTHAQLRNSSTTGILECELEKDISFNQGIFIDIFVLDGLTDDIKLLKKQGREGEFIKKLMRIHALQDSRYGIANIITRIFSWKFLVNRMDKCLKRYSVNETANVANLGMGFDIGKRITIRDKRYYAEVEYLDFEMLKIPVSGGYHEWLSMKYGDYMIARKEGSMHGGVIFDTNISYKDFLKIDKH